MKPHFIKICPCTFYCR